MENKYGKDGASKRIYATTDKEKGALRKLATEEGYETFVVPDDIGGRFSVLTAVGLLPIAVAGIDIDSMMRELLTPVSLQQSKPDGKRLLQYAAVRNALYRKNKTIEIMVNYEPSLHYSQNGGNSSTEKVKERIKKVYSRPELTSLRTFIPWDSIYRMDSGTYLNGNQG